MTRIRDRLGLFSIIDRYLLREILLAGLAIVVVLLAMVISYRLARYLNQAASGLLAQDAIWLLLGLQAVRFLVILIPLAALLAIMLTLGRLYRASEMAALKACGLQPRHVYRPLLLFAVPLAGLLAWMTLDLVPRAINLHEQVIDQAREKAELTLLAPGQFRVLMQGEHVVYVGALSEDNLELRDVFVRSLTAEGQVITTARSGRQLIDTQENSRYLILEDGFRYEQNSAGYNTLQFGTLTLRLEELARDLEIRRHEARPTRELLASEEPALRAELQQRLSAPIALVLLTLLAPLLAHSNPREGRYGRVVLALLVYGLYINMLSVGQNWLERERLPLALGLWWIHALMAGLVLTLMLQQHPPPWLLKLTRCRP